MSKYLFILLFVSTNTYADSTNWFTPKVYLQSDIKNCEATISNYVSKEREENKIYVDVIPAEFRSWTLDINLDGTEDYFILTASSVTCGTAGCRTKLFVSSESGCMQIHSPHIHTNLAVGYDGKYVYLQGQGHQGRCGVWELINTKMKHYKNIDKCPE